MKLENVAVFFRHKVEIELRQSVVVVVMANGRVLQGFREGPKPIELHRLTQLHGHAGNHQAGGQAVLFHAFSSPEAGQILQVAGMEIYNLLSCIRLVQSIVYFKRRSGVDLEGKRWK